MSDDRAYGWCCACGCPIKYSPIRMPLGPPTPDPKKPWHYGIMYRDMCCTCVKKQLPKLEKKILRGEMCPVSTWVGEDDPQIVSLNHSSPQEEPVGWLRRLWNWIY